MKLSIRCLDHQCRYIVGIENLRQLQNDRCDDLVNEIWCGFDFGYCNSPEPNSEGIKDTNQFNVVH